MKKLTAISIGLFLAGLALGAPKQDLGPEPEVRDILKQLTDPSLPSEERNKLNERLEKHGKPLVPGLAAALNDKDTQIRRAAVFALSQIGPDAKAAVPALIKALDDPDKGKEIGGRAISDCAADTLAIIGPGAAEAIPALMGIARSSLKRDLRMRAVWALGEIGPQSKEVIPLLRKLMKDDKEAELIRARAAQALGRIGPKAREAVPDLIKALEIEDKQDPNHSLRWNAAEALGKIGPEAKSAIPTLKRLVANPKLERAARYALMKLGE